MIYLEQLKLKNHNYPGSRVLPLDHVFEFDDVNLFVGNQGTGKSTLLSLIQKAGNEYVDFKISNCTVKHGVETRYFNSETDNPRITDPQMYANMDGSNKPGIGMAGAIAARFQSHGEVLAPFILKPLKSFKNTIIILDEPEAGLSIHNQYKVIDAIKVAVKNGNQLFIATHCYPLICRNDVYSFDTFEKMSGTKFIGKLQ
jgi:Predicted ATPase